MSNEPSADDFLHTIQNLLVRLNEIQAELRSNPTPEAYSRLAEVRAELDRLHPEAERRTSKEFRAARKSVRELLRARQVVESDGEQATLTVNLSGPIPPATLAEILMAFDTLHRALAGTPLRDLVAKIGLPDEVLAYSRGRD